MTDPTQDTNYLIRRRRLLNQMQRSRRIRDRDRSLADNQVFSADWLGRDAASGRAILRNSDGSIYRGSEVITDGQILPGQRILGLRSPEGFATANQMPAPPVKPKPPREQTSIEDPAHALYLVQLLYNGNTPVPCSCEEKQESSLAILYETVQQERVPCTCSTYNRVGNRCLPVCDGTGKYATLQECLAAPQPPWPDPEGEDGHGGYVVIYAGYRVGTPSGISWQYGPIQGGLFYHSQAGTCDSANMLLVDHLAPASYVRARPSEFPFASVPPGAFWVYYYLPMVARLDEARYPPGAILVSQKNEISTGASRVVDENGWFLYSVAASDIWIQGSPGYWFSGNDIAYLYYFVYKYVPANNFSSSMEPPQPPSSIGGINIQGVTLFQNHAAIICSPFNSKDDTCQDPGRGSSPVACPYPKEKRSRQIWSFFPTKDKKLKIHTFNYSDPFQAYLVATGTEKSFVRAIAGRRNNQWCKIIDATIAGNSLLKQAYSNPNLPVATPEDWKTALFNYTYTSGQLPPNLPQYISTNINSQYVNIQLDSETGSNYRLGFNASQAVQIGTNWGSFSNLIKQGGKIEEVRVCLAPFDGVTSSPSGESTLPGKGIKLKSLSAIGNQNASIIAISAFVDSTDLANAYSISTTGCRGNIYLRGYQERYYSGKQSMLRDLGLIDYNDIYPPELSYVNSVHRLTVKDCQGAVVRSISAIYGGQIEPYGSKQIIGICQ